MATSMSLIPYLQQLTAQQYILCMHCSAKHELHGVEQVDPADIVLFGLRVRMCLSTGICEGKEV